MTVIRAKNPSWTSVLTRLIVNTAGQLHLSLYQLLLSYTTNESVSHGLYKHNVSSPYLNTSTDGKNYWVHGVDEVIPLRKCRQRCQVKLDTYKNS